MGEETCPRAGPCDWGPCDWCGKVADWHVVTGCFGGHTAYHSLCAGCLLTLRRLLIQSQLHCDHDYCDSAVDGLLARSGTAPEVELIRE